MATHQCNPLPVLRRYLISEAWYAIIAGFNAIVLIGQVFNDACKQGVVLYQLVNGWTQQGAYQLDQWSEQSR